MENGVPHMSKQLQLIVALAAIAAVGVFSSVSVAGTSSPTKGPIPDKALKNGNIDKSMVPDFIPQIDSRGVSVGWIAKDFAIPDESFSDAPIPVLGNDLKTIVGYNYAGVGFVPNGVNPTSVSAPGSAPTTTAK